MKQSHNHAEDVDWGISRKISAKINAEYIGKAPNMEKENRIFHETTYSESGRNRRSDHASGCGVEHAYGGGVS
jgi:hypothetical protein